MKRKYLINILKEYGINKQVIEELAIRIDSLYSESVKDDLLHARMAVHGLAEVLKNVAPKVFEKDNEWNLTVKQQLYLINQSHPTPEISKEYPFKCNKCGFEFTSDDLGHTYLTCTQPFPQRTSGICGGAIELNYPPQPEQTDREIAMKWWSSISTDMKMMWTNEYFPARSYKLLTCSNIKHIFKDKQETESVSKESSIANSIEHIFKNNERIHGKSKSIDWIKLSAHKTASYLLQSHSTFEISDKDKIKMYLKRYPNIMMNGFNGADLRQAYFRGIDDVISKAAQPEVAHCTQCGYHYDSLLKECPTCKGAKSMNEEKIEEIYELFCDWYEDDGSYDEEIKAKLILAINR